MRGVNMHVHLHLTGRLLPHLLRQCIQSQVFRIELPDGTNMQNMGETWIFIDKFFNHTMHVRLHLTGRLLPHLLRQCIQSQVFRIELPDGTNMQNMGETWIFIDNFFNHTTESYI